MSTRRQFTLKFDESVEDYVSREFPDVTDFRIKSESLDARKANLGRKPNIHYIIETINEKAGEQFEPLSEVFPTLKPLKTRPLIIGAGPAGLFCALRFAEYGIPCVILERGEMAHKRMLHISKYWRRGQLDEDNNVCYGEGGAGLFSDGKLITRVKSSYVQYVMNKFVEFGAPPETAWVSNPHLGSNKIRQLIGKMTASLVSHGNEIHYNSRVHKLIYDGNKVVGVELEDQRKFYSDHIILATGHSAKEMYHHLKDNKVAMQAKDFAVGVRVEHPRRIIDGIQHGSFAGAELGSARYRLSWEDPETKKGSYSFCMCPGGYVLSSGTDTDGIVVNGMSNYARNSPWSNAALVVSVKAGQDFDPSNNILAGLDFQNGIEQLAFSKSQEYASGKEVPVQNMIDFMDGKLSGELPKTSCPSGIFESDLHKILPEFISGHLRNALQVFDRRMKGFVTKESLLLAPETRTSAPVTISRDRESLESLSHKGLYPCGEGAGYAGGITSAAIDGVKVAMSILKEYL